MMLDSVAARGVALASAVPPLDPDEETARDWLQQELSKGEYQQSQPTLLDLIVQWFSDWLASLDPNVSAGAFNPTGLVVVVIVVVLILLAVFLGRPALARRSAVSKDRRVFLEDDMRTVAELRAASETAARSGDFALAVAERYRAVARALGDRTVIAIRPGSTAHDVARRAAVPFPDERDALEGAASDFDDVRYLDRPGTEAAWMRVRDLDARLERARPATLTELERVHS